MASVPPPHGMNEVDYEAIEAAVTETVRGRWFLAEFARRNRLAETRQLVEAMARIEAAMTGGQVALPSADPSIRLLIQRIKEVASQLGTVADDMREAGVDEYLVAAVELQGRAVAGMMRGGPPPRGPLPAREAGSPKDAAPAKDALPPGRFSPTREVNIPDTTGNPEPPPAPMPIPGPSADDPRLAVLSGLDGMTLTKKLALFS